jgi:hypothetical protein
MRKREMKTVAAVLIACSLSASAAAYAQPVVHAKVDVQRTAQATVAPATNERAPRRLSATPAGAAGACVGPASFCNTYFGS